jgi:chemotaxis methyl-accepting protein methylase/chemotaxis signal transduction protein
VRRLAGACRAEAARLEGELLAAGAGERLSGVYLALRAADSEALVAAAQVEEVLPGAALGPIEEDRQRHVVGTFVHRGEVLAAFDLASLLGAPRPVPGSFSLLVFGGGRPFGLLVDSLAVLSGAPVVLAADPAAAGGGAPVRAEVTCARGVRPVLNLPALVASMDGQGSESSPAALAVLQLRRELLWRFGLSLPRPLRERLAAHLERLQAETGTPPAAGLPRILAGRNRVALLLEAVVAGEGYFMRHPNQFAAVRRLVASRDAGLPPFRAWSAGCGAGEEPYSLAMAMLQAGARPGAGGILATDVSPGALAHARAGRYGRWSFRGEHPELRPFLSGDAAGAEVAPAVRRLVEFRRHDLLLEDPPAGDLDLVLCRNVLSLLDGAEAVRVARSVFQALRPGGSLILGASEDELGASLPAERVSRDGVTLFRRPWSQRPGRVRSRPPRRRPGQVSDRYQR